MHAALEEYILAGRSDRIELIKLILCESSYSELVFCVFFQLAILGGFLRALRARGQTLRARRLQEEANRAPSLPPRLFLYQLCESFVAQSEYVCQELLEGDRLEHQDVQAQDPHVLLGVTKVVILRALLRARGSGGVMLATGTTLKDKYIAGKWWPENEQKLFEVFKNAREILEGVKEVSDEDAQWMEKYLVDGAEKAGEADGWKATVCSMICGMSIDVLRLRAFKIRKERWRLMYEKLGRVADDPTGGTRR